MGSQAMKTITPYAECTGLLKDPEQLRMAATERGYLFFRGLFPPEDLLAVRRDVLRVAERHGFLRHGSDPEEGLARDGVFVSENAPTPEYRSYYNDVLRLRSFHALAHHPALLRVLRKLFGEPVLVHPRHICHTVFPGRKQFTTPPHQDFHPVRGTPDTWTVWTPLGDCGPELGGGLGIVPGSHRRGMIADDDDAIELEVDPDAAWVWSPTKCGDAVMFYSLSIHQARDNVSGDRIRVATSFRNQPASHPVDEHSLIPHMRWLDWDDIYADWPADDPLRYYWRSLDLRVQPHWKSDRADSAPLVESIKGD